MFGFIGLKIIHSHYVYWVVYFAYTLYSNMRKLPNELAKWIFTEHLITLNLA